MTQKERIVKYMDDFGSISTMEAFTQLGITRLASRIHELTRNGLAIKKEMVSSKNRYGEEVYYVRYSKAV